MDYSCIYKSYHIFINITSILLLCCVSFFISSPDHQSNWEYPDSFRPLKSLNDSESKCSCLKTSLECGGNPGGYIDYLKLLNCVFSFSHIVGHVVLFLWLLVLFYLLGNTASQYFCPLLDSLSRVLNLSPTISGVTLLSLGNGAPDVFSSIVSFDGSAATIGLNSVLGGAFFVSSVVVGVISINCSSNCRMVAVDHVGFVRDLCFFLLAIFSLILIFSVGKVHIYGSIAFVSLYIVYVILVYTIHYSRKKLGELEAPLLESIEVEQPTVEAQESKQADVNLSPLLAWFLFLIELPLFLPRRLTIPVVTEERWSKPFIVASVILSPMLLAILWIYRASNMDSEQSIAIFFFAVLIGIIFGIIAMKGTKSSHPPKLLLPWLAGGFLMSVVWTYIIAGELVSLLVSEGHILEVSPSVLGVTILAWGNSLGDLVSNVAMAINGGENGAQIAIAGCYAGPIFNILVGLGMSLVLSAWVSHPSPFVIPEDSSQYMVIGFLIAGLLWALLILLKKGMKLNTTLGVGLLAIYSCFLCLRLLQSSALR